MPTEKFKCIYCKSEKPLSYFTSDHVIPKSLGKFGTNTLTLINQVCGECNQYFGDTVENNLARDTLYGVIYRSVTGLIDAKEFHENKRHQRNSSQAYVKNRLYGDMLVYVSDFNIEESLQFQVSLANQLVLMNSTKGVQAHFYLDKIPHRRILEDLGLKISSGYIRFYLQYDNFEKNYYELKRCLKEADIVLNLCKYYFTEIDTRKGDQYLEFSHTLGDDVLRAVVKIAFNYFAYCYGSAAISNSFDPIREYIRYGEIPDFKVIQGYRQLNRDMTERRFVKNDIFGHKVEIRCEPRKSIIVKITLFNDHFFRIMLSENYSVLLPDKSIFFNVSKKTISHG